MNEGDSSFNYLELSELKRKYEELENDIRKLRIENTRKEKEIQKLREDVQKYRKPSNDSSTNYPWPDEFVERWKKLVENTIMDSFDNIFYKNILLVRVINITVRIVYDIADEKIKEKIKEILNCFGYDNFNNDDIKLFFNKFQSIIFQDYFKTIIKFNDELLNKILLNIRLEISTQKGKLFSEEEIKEIEKDLDSKNIIPFIKELFTLSLYMIIHDPQLTIFTTLDLRYCYFSKKEIVLDGFGKEDAVCLIILTPPLLKLNTYFKKLFPIVFICENPTENMIKQCEEKRINELKKEQSKSFCGNTNQFFSKENEKENKISITNINTPNIKKQIMNNNDIHQNYINTTSTISTTTYTSNRNYNNFESNKEKIIKKIIDNNFYKTPNDINNKKKEYMRSKSSTKQNPFFFKNQEKTIQKQIDQTKRNNTINDLKENNNNKCNINNIIIQSNKKTEQHIFNTINKVSTYNNINNNINNMNNINNVNNNNQKREKSFIISQEEQRQLDNSLKQKKEIKNKSKLSLNKMDKSRNSSTYDLEINNHSKEKILDNYPIKLVTEIPQLHQNKTPIIKNRTNSMDSFSDTSQNNLTPINTTISENNKKITSINAIIANNQKKVKTTIRKVNTVSNNMKNNINNNISNKINNINNSHLRKTASSNIEPSHLVLGQNNNFNKNTNYNNINHKVSHSHIDKNNNQNFENNNDNTSYRNSTRDLIRNNSHSNENNNSNNISSNSICSNNSNRTKNKGMKNNYSNNYLVNKNQTNQIGKVEFISNKNNNNNNTNIINNNIINNNQSKNILGNPKKGFDYYNTQPIKTDCNILSEGIKLQENSTISSNRMSNTNTIKNPYFFTNDIKSMGKFFKNDIQKRNKALLAKKIDVQMNYESGQYQNIRINSPSGRSNNNIKNKFNNNNIIMNKVNQNRDASLNNKKYHSSSINPIDKHKNKK